MHVHTNIKYFSAVTIPGRSGLRTPVVARDFIFSRPVHIGSSTHSASSTMCTGALSLRGEAATHPFLGPRLKMVRTTPPFPLWACIGMSATWALIRNLGIKCYLWHEVSRRKLAGRGNASDLYSECALFEPQPGRRPAILTQTSWICLPVEDNSRRELHILHYWSLLHARHH